MCLVLYSLILFILSFCFGIFIYLFVIVFNYYCICYLCMYLFIYLFVCLVFFLVLVRLVNMPVAVILNVNNKEIKKIVKLKKNPPI